MRPAAAHPAPAPSTPVACAFPWRSLAILSGSVTWWNGTSALAHSRAHGPGPGPVPLWSTRPQRLPRSPDPGTCTLGGCWLDEDLGSWEPIPLALALQAQSMHTVLKTAGLMGSPVSQKPRCSSCFQLHSREQELRLIRDCPSRPRRRSSLVPPHEPIVERPDEDCESDAGPSAAPGDPSFARGPAEALVLGPPS
ncbi:unnamed protein product [Caretta caretta]